MKKFMTTDGKNTVKRLSKWINIKTAYNVRKNNSLYDFCTDENGYNPGGKDFNPENGTLLDYFVFQGRKYAVSQFITIGSSWCGGVPYEFTDTDGKSTFITGVDFYGDMFNPLYIETDEFYKKVRVYEIN